jgi:hypothetical protein
MSKLTAEDVARLRAAKRAIFDNMILVAVAFERGDPEGIKTLKTLRSAHRRIARYLDADKAKAPPTR